VTEHATSLFLSARNPPQWQLMPYVANATAFTLAYFIPPYPTRPCEVLAVTAAINTNAAAAEAWMSIYKASANPPRTPLSGSRYMDSAGFVSNVVSAAPYSVPCIARPLWPYYLDPGDALYALVVSDSGTAAYVAQPAAMFVQPQTQGYA
jgi:hypothetical protein